jgi:HEAT repeats
VRSRAAEAMAHMKSDDAVDALVGALNDDSPWVRRDVANALGQLGRRRAVEPLKSHLSDVQSKDSAFQNAIWFVRRNAGTNAPLILIDCLDLASPSVTNYYNYTLVWQIHSCGGPKLTYHHDFDKEGTPQQIEENRRRRCEN